MVPFSAPSGTFSLMSFWHICPPSRGDSLGHPQQSLASSNAHFPSEHPWGGGDLWPPTCKHHLMRAATLPYCHVSLGLSALMGTHSNGTSESPHLPAPPSRTNASSWWALKPPWGHNARCWAPGGWGCPALGAETPWHEGAYLDLGTAGASLPAPAAPLSPGCPCGAGHQCCLRRRARGTSVPSPCAQPPAERVLCAGL